MEEVKKNLLNIHNWQANMQNDARQNEEAMNERNRCMISNFAANYLMKEEQEIQAKRIKTCEIFEAGEVIVTSKPSEPTKSEIDNQNSVIVIELEEE